MDECEKAYMMLCEIRTDQHPEMFDELPGNPLDWGEETMYEFNIFKSGWDAAMRKQEDEMENILASVVGMRKARKERKSWNVTMKKKGER